MTEMLFVTFFVLYYLAVEVFGMVKPAIPHAGPK